MPQLNGSLFQQELLEGEYSPYFYAYYYKRWHDYRMSYHRHQSTEIMYLISGVCRVDLLIEKNNPASFSLKRGELILINAGVPHRLIVDGDTPCRMLNVEFGFVLHKGIAPSLAVLARQEKAVAKLLSTPFNSLFLPGTDEVYHTLRNLVLELDKCKGQGGNLAQLLFTELLLRLAEIHIDLEIKPFRPSDGYVRQSIDYLYQNYDRQIRMKELAAAVNLHPGYLHRIFKAHTGFTVTDYLTRIRMEKAKMLLGQSDVPVTEIADYVGIASRQYFHLLFKKYTGVTPVDYRNGVDRHLWDHSGAEEYRES
ncbi:Bifunctional transcriptional activator/DNA repair enzyme AdaA [compost metagenome]